ncbi:MAG TPA: hypothetical protein VMW73_06855 [Spirochaetia bacterium]|nr:hypothetical protein [Spirochaetia bacterium]
MRDYRNEHSETSLLEGVLRYTKVLFEYRRFIVIVTVCVVALATAFAILSRYLPPDKSPLPNTYAAQASILIQQDGRNDLASSLLEGLGLAQSANASSSFRNGDLVLEVLNSRMLLDRVISDFELISRYHITGNVKGKSRQIVLHKSIFDYARNTGLLKVSYVDIDPTLSRDVVNRMVALLEEWFNTNSGLAVQQQRRALEEKLTEVRSEIQSLQDRLQALQEMYGVLNVEDLGRSQATLLATLRAQLILREIDIKNYSSISRIDDPRLEQLKNERQNLLDLIYQNEKNVSRVPGEQKSLAAVAQEFSELRTQIDIQQRVYNTLAPQYEAAKLAPASIFQVLERAEIPDTKSGPERSRIVLFAFIVAFLGSCILAFILHGVRQIRGVPSEKLRVSLLESQPEDKSVEAGSIAQSHRHSR